MPAHPLINLTLECFNTIERILNAPPEFCAWMQKLLHKPIHEGFVIKLYNALRWHVDSDIRETIARGRRLVLHESTASGISADVFHTLTDIMDNVGKDYNYNYYYVRRRFYPTECIDKDKPEVGDYNYEEQFAQYNYLISLPAPAPHPIETYSQFADISEHIKEVAYYLFETLLGNLCATVFEYAVIRKKKIDAVVASSVGAALAT